MGGDANRWYPPPADACKLAAGPPRRFAAETCGSVTEACGTGLGEMGGSGTLNGGWVGIGC